MVEPLAPKTAPSTESPPSRSGKGGWGVRSVRIGEHVFPASGGPHLAGVVNISPESPNKDAVVDGVAGAVARARALAAAGVALVDIGAQSSHFAAPLVTVEQERERLLPVVTALKAAGFLVSVDTWDAGVVRAVAAAGADVINDSDGFQHPEVIEAVAAAGLPVIIPFLSGPNPRQLHAFDEHNPLTVMLPWFAAALARAERAGVREVILDPGTGYAQPQLSTEAKEAFQRRVYPRLGEIKALGPPLLVALPRKASRLVTLELARMIIASGADFLRVHDPELAREAIRLERGEHQPVEQPYA